MTSSPNEFPEADRIVDDVLSGKRVFLLWPGTGTVVAVIMLHVLAIGLAMGPTFSAAVPWLRSHISTWQPLIFVAGMVSLPWIIIPAALLIRGSDYGYPALLFSTRTWFVGSALMAAASALDWLRAPAWPYGVTCGLLSIAYAVEHSETCKIYVLLRQRLRARLEERNASSARRDPD